MYKSVSGARYMMGIHGPAVELLTRNGVGMLALIQFSNHGVVVGPEQKVARMDILSRLSSRA